MNDTRIGVPPAEGFRMLGIGRTKGYDLVKSGQLRIYKMGRRSILKVEELRSFIDNLPTAS